MGYVAQLLAHSEHIRNIHRGHWITLLTTIVVDVAVSIVILGLSVAGILVSPPWTWFGLLLLLVPVGHLALRIWDWWNRQYIVTNRRIMYVVGTVNKRVSDTFLEKINDVVMEQSALGRLLDFGDIEIISGSESGIDVFTRIAHPIAFKKALLASTETSSGERATLEREGDGRESSAG